VLDLWDLLWAGWRHRRAGGQGRGPEKAEGDSSKETMNSVVVVMPGDVHPTFVAQPTSPDLHDCSTSSLLSLADGSSSTPNLNQQDNNELSLMEPSAVTPPGQDAEGEGGPSEREEHVLVHIPL